MIINGPWARRKDTKRVTPAHAISKFILFVVKTPWTGRPLPPHLFSKLQTETSYKEGEEEGDTDPKRNEKKRKEKKKKKKKTKRRIPIKLLLIQSNFASSVSFPHLFLFHFPSDLSYCFYMGCVLFFNFFPSCFFVFVVLWIWVLREWHDLDCFGL